MKKYRYTKTVHLSPWGKGLTFVYFFLGWNVIGYVAYKLLTKQYAKKHPEFENLSTTDKYLAIVGRQKEDIKTVTFKPFGGKKSEQGFSELHEEKE